MKNKQIIAVAAGLALVSSGAFAATNDQVDHGPGWNNRDCYNSETGAQCQQRLSQQQQQRSGATSQGGGGRFQQQGGGEVDHGPGWNNRDCYNSETGAQCQQRLSQQQQQRSGNTSQGGGGRFQQQGGNLVDHGPGWNNRDCYNWETGAECQRRRAQQQAERNDRNRWDRDRDRDWDRGRDRDRDWDRGWAWNSRECYRGESPRDCRERIAYQQRTRRSYVWRNGRYEDRDNGAAVAAGILGFILGAAIAGSESDRDYYVAHRYDRRWRDRCRAAYSSFDYDSGTYLGRDGYRYYCVR